MKRLLCLIGIHDFGKWSYIKPIGRYEQKLMRFCKRCGRSQIYIGQTQTNKLTGEQTPYEKI